MPEKYRITTEDGVFEVTTGEDGGSSEPRVGLGQMKYEASQPPMDDSPRQAPSMMERVGQQMFQSAAHPQSMGDFLGLILGGAKSPGTGGMLRSGSMPSLPTREGVGKGMQTVGRVMRHPTQAPGRAIEWAGMKVAGQKPVATQSGHVMPATDAAAQAAESSRPLIHLANQPLPDMQQIETAARAMGLSRERMLQLLQGRTADVLSSNLNKF